YVQLPLHGAADHGARTDPDAGRRVHRESAAGGGAQLAAERRPAAYRRTPGDSATDQGAEPRSLTRLALGGAPKRAAHTRRSCRPSANPHAAATASSVIVGFFIRSRARSTRSRSR